VLAEAAVSWRLEGDFAYLRCGPLETKLSFKLLSSGLLRPHWEKAPADFSVMQLKFPQIEVQPKLRLLEWYIRGGDLIATFERVAPLTVSPQIYWRASYDQAVRAVGMEVVLSMQTDLLDSMPQSAVDSLGFNVELMHASQLDAQSFSPLTSTTGLHGFNASESSLHLFVMRTLKNGPSYAEVVHPSDFVSAEIDYRGEEYGSFRVRSLLFPESLEKGVIRRARICGWFLPAENDLEVAVELARRFVNEPPPLTT